MYSTFPRPPQHTILTTNVCMCRWRLVLVLAVPVVRGQGHLARESQLHRAVRDLEQHTHHQVSCH